MEEVYKIISELLRLTELMNEGLKTKDIDMVVEMIEKRNPLIQSLESCHRKDLHGSISEKVERLLCLDQENNDLMLSLTNDMREKINLTGQKKSSAKKKNNAVKRYLSDGQGDNYSKFNKKT